MILLAALFLSMFPPTIDTVDLYAASGEEIVVEVFDWFDVPGDFDGDRDCDGDDFLLWQQRYLVESWADGEAFERWQRAYPTGRLRVTGVVWPSIHALSYDADGFTLQAAEGFAGQIRVTANLTEAGGREPTYLVEFVAHVEEMLSE